MVYTRDWSNTIPIDHTTFASQPSHLRNARVDIDERLKNWIYGFTAGEAETSDGFKQIPLRAQGADPASKASCYQLYGKDVLIGGNTDTELHSVHETGGVQQLTYIGKLWIEALKMASEAQGDILVRGASAMGRLAIGTAGQLLKVNAGATALEYFTASYVQVQTLELTAVDTTPNSIPDDDSLPQSGTEGKVGGTLTITPTAIGNKILVFGTAFIQCPINGVAVAYLSEAALGANALSVGVITNAGGNYTNNVQIPMYLHTVTSLNALNFELNFGSSIGDSTLNGYVGVRKFGASVKSGLVAVEIKV